MTASETNRATQEHSQQEVREDGGLRRVCSVCQKAKARKEYSKNQWKKGEALSKCVICIDSSCGESQYTEKQQEQRSVGTTGISKDPRPQKAVGFGGLTEGQEQLTVCSDWPKTKSGQPPGAQSAIFMPLLACAMGEALQGHYTKDQLDQAQLWWTAALPPWPRWVQSLRKAGVQTRYKEFLWSSSSIKGNPNPLIHKAKGHGTVPHLKGKLQRELLELDPTVAWELDACIHGLYTEN